MTTLFGRCALCAQRTSKAAMSKHVALCASRHDKPKGPPGELFQLRVEGKGLPMYWLDVEIKGQSPLRRLDDFLRRIWLECCGHMSAFEAGGVRYPVLIDNEFGDARDERSMSTEVFRVLTAPGQRLSYEYDFGSTTHLSIRVIGMRTGTIGRPATRLLARNEPPVWGCAACDAVATLVCPLCVHESNPFVCTRHAAEHDCADEESFLPVVDSPRTGVCGYTGVV